ncbi:Lectin-domain containing receptor kinase A4.3 [Hordeum vulgare]|nr:Lectin-domain containing receptor kinase A4.3 [Hordeum vulgare]
MQPAKRKGQRHAEDAREETAAATVQQEATNACVAAATREEFFYLGLNPRHHGLVTSVVAAASTSSSTFLWMVLPESPRGSMTHPIPGFHVYPQASRLYGECSPEVSMMAPSTPVPAPIDLNTTPVASASLFGDTKKHTREMPADVLPGARNLFNTMIAVVDDETTTISWRATSSKVVWRPQVDLDVHGFPLDHEFPKDYDLEEEDKLDISREPLFEEDLTNQAAGSKPKRKIKNMRAYTEAEDKLLCECWKDIGQDAKVGAEQKASTFWLRVHSEFHERKKFLPYKMQTTRGWVSISKRWRVVQQECDKFGATLASIKARPVSGIGIQDMVFQALEAFKVQHEGKSFNLSHCCRVINE